MTNKERQIIVRKIMADTNRSYIITHGTDTLIETAVFLKKGVQISLVH